MTNQRSSVRPETAAGETSAAGWTSRFQRSVDYWDFAKDAAPEAAVGDARAQYLLAKVLGECHINVALNRRLYPDPTMSPEEMFEASFWREAGPSLPNQYVELSRRKFMKCAKFFAGDPPILDHLHIGSDAHSDEYWMTQALKNSDPVAVIEHVYGLATDLDSMGEEQRNSAIDQIREGLTIAAKTADPEAVFRIGILVSYVGASDPVEGAAWTLAACEIGYDCTYANPAIGQDCVELGMCTGAESVVLNMQRDSGLQFGLAYARSQDIVDLLQRDYNRAVNELFEKLDLGQ